MQRQEGRRNDSAFHVGGKEVGHVLSDFVGQRVGGGKRTCLVRPVSLHYADNLFRVYLDVGQADTVTRFVDGDFAAARRVEGFVDVVQTHGTLAVGGIQFHDNLVGQAADSRSDTAGSRQVDFTVGSNLACLDDGNIHFSHETVTDFLSHL